MLETVKVYKYKKSGKLIAVMGNGTAIPLNQDLTLSNKPFHRIKYHTELELTSCRLELNVKKTSEENTVLVTVVRLWDENHLPQKSTDPAAPIEHKIDVSPSNEFNQSENEYVGKTNGHSLGWFTSIASIMILATYLYILIITNSPINIRFVCPMAIVLLFGIFIIKLTANDGDPQKIQEVKEGKARLQHKLEEDWNNTLNKLHEWTKLDGIGFERAVAKLFTKQGFSVTHTPRSYDNGVDLILNKDNITTIVQCKAYSKNIGVAPVRELQGVRASWPEASNAMLVGLYDFSKSAKQFAEKHGIVLYSISHDHLKTACRKNPNTKHKPNLFG